MKKTNIKIYLKQNILKTVEKLYLDSLSALLQK